MIDGGQCDKIYSSHTAVLCFDNHGYWLKELDRCTGCPDITEILNQSIVRSFTLAPK